MVPNLTILSTVVVRVVPYLVNDIRNLDSLFIGSEINLSGDETHAGVPDASTCLRLSMIAERVAITFSVS